jgi:copper(I)-binding protein
VNATRTRRRSVAAAAVALLAVPALSACGVSFGAATDQPYQPSDGVIDRSGPVDVLNALVVSATPGSGRLVVGLVNNTDEDDELTGVVGAGEDDSVSYELGAGETTIPAGELLDLSDDDAAVVAVTGSEESVIPGKFVRLTLQFESADDVTVNVPVLDQNEDYADVELPSAEEGASPTETPTETPTESSTESPEE